MTDSNALDEIVRVSRELGGDPSFVLHGGGNTSIKGVSRDVTGADVDTVWVKGSGWDLATMEAPGFSPLRRGRLLEVLSCESLSDEQMVNEIRQASFDASAPTASIEALLHAFLPAKVVLHSHADAIVALTNQSGRAQSIEEILGDGVVVLPYIMPGFDLARAVAEAFSDGFSGVDALVLSNHGLFTFNDDPDAALARHRELVARASQALGVSEWGDPGEEAERRGAPADLARFRAELSLVAGRPMIVAQSASSVAAEFASRSDIVERTARGTATPEHVIRTKRQPLVGRDVDAFAEAYRRYVDENRAGRDIVEIDPAPRVVLDPEWGMLAAGSTVKDAAIARDVYLHTMQIIDAADEMSAYASLDERDTFDIEYWSLEQAKLAKSNVAEFESEIVIVTGAASGIGRACAQRLLEGGAAVVGIDLNPSVATTFDSPSWRGVVGDVSDADVLKRAADTAVRDFGGVDVLVIAAGIFPPSAPIAELDDRAWDAALAVNTTAVARALREMHPYLALAPRGGRVVLVSTKNVAAPGPGVAAYSASKTAAAQLARVAALEWAADGIRVNSVEPDAVFDTAIWTPELLEKRAANYGLTVDEYKTRNLLKMEVTSRMVADAVAVFAATALPATTGAHLSVDGGNDRVV